MLFTACVLFNDIVCVSDKYNLARTNYVICFTEWLSIWQLIHSFSDRKRNFIIHTQLLSSSRWVRDYCLMPNSPCMVYIMVWPKVRLFCLWCCPLYTWPASVLIMMLFTLYLTSVMFYYDVVHFLLDQRSWSFKMQSACNHVTAFEHIVLIVIQVSYCYYYWIMFGSREAAIPIYSISSFLCIVM